MPIRTVLTITGLVCLLGALTAAPASARQALAELRVEGPGATLDPGTWYVTGTERFKRGKGDECDNRSGHIEFRGPNAGGILGSADDVRDSLRPVRVRNTDFGPQICQVGDFRSFGNFSGDFGGWVYWLDYAFGSASADQTPLSGGERVLWIYSEFDSTPVNTGMALHLKRVPARSGDGQFVVKVVVHDFGGAPTPVSDATIAGAESATPLGNGRYRVEVGNGFSTLRATRGLDIPSNRVRTCFRADTADCPRAHGRRIIGSPRGDGIRGTRGWDVIRSGAGNDLIGVRSGGRDRVNCGRGRDVVVKDAGDSDNQVADNCEHVVPR